MGSHPSAPRRSERASSVAETVAEVDEPLDPLATPQTSAPAASQDPPRDIGRFALLDELGRGGMGVVFAAFDPRLDRKVALKVVRPSSHRDLDHVRLLREARAMAKLSHPNVVHVYDVGEYEGQVYIAMEMVEGQTLRDVLKSDVPVTQALELLRQAGRGLAAAHQAGLVHRDFKPENVLVGADGRARVADFGLVHPVSGATPREDQVIDDGGQGVTGTGALMGTPAYMAPEQFLRLTTDARTDQFAFAICYYEGLCGRRPFAGESLASLAVEVVEGTPRPLPAAADASAQVRRAIERGLSRSPEERFPSMEALLEQLEPAPRRRMPVLAVGTLAFGAMALGLLVRPGSTETPPMVCDGAPDRVAEVWSEERRERLQQGLERVEPTTSASINTVADRTERYLERWSRAHLRLCRARARGLRSQAVVDRESACLERGIRALDAVLTRLESPRPGDLERAPIALSRLADPAECGIPGQLPDAGDGPLTDSELAANVEELDRALARLESSAPLNTPEEQSTSTAEVLAGARATAHEPLVARALLVHAEALLELGSREEARRARSEALGLAMRSEDRGALAWASLALFDMALNDGDRADRLSTWTEVSAAAVAGAGSPPAMVLEHELLLARLSAATVDYAGALRHIDAADQTRDLLDPDDPRLIGLDLEEVRIATQAALHERAEAAFARALARSRRLYGDDHPSMGTLHRDRGIRLVLAGRFEEALADFERAAELIELRFGVDHPRTVEMKLQIAIALDEQGRHEDALVYLQGAMAAQRRAGRADSELSGIIENSRCYALYRLSRHDEAAAACERALGAFEAVGEAQGTSAAIVRVNQALIERGRGHPELALSHDRAAVDTLDRLLGDDEFTSYALLGLGEDFLALDDPELAVEPLERALRIRTQRSPDPGLVAEAQWALGRALWARGKDPERARLLVRSAVDGWSSGEGDWDATVAQARAWLDAHGED